MLVSQAWGTVALGFAVLAACTVAALGGALIGVRWRSRGLDDLVARERAYRGIFEQTLLAMAVLRLEERPDGWGARVERANGAVAGLLGAGVDDADWVRLLAPEQRDGHRLTLAALAEGRLPGWQGELNVAGADDRHIQVALAVLPDHHGTHRLAAQLVDVTDRHRAEGRLREAAMRDPLTGLPNRALLADRLSMALAASARSLGHVAVAFCDLDDFKAVNDSAGHAVGDVVLVEAAARLRDAVRPSDTVARVGGDEFVVLCPGVPDAPTATEIGERLLAALVQPVEVDGRMQRCGGSVGLVVAGPLATPHLTPDALLDAADRVMYEAKRTGKSRLHLRVLGADGEPLDGVVDVRRTPHLTLDPVEPAPAVLTPGSIVIDLPEQREP